MVHYSRRFYGESSVLVTGAREVARVVPGLYIARIDRPDEYRPEYMVEMVSVEPGPALDHVPPCHDPAVADYMAARGGWSLRVY